MQDDLALMVILIIGFFVVAVASSVILKKLRIPYTIGLVLIGIIFGFLLNSLDYPLLAKLNLTPDVILYLILPTLIYDAAINMDLKALQKNIVPIILLAVPGLLISAGIVGGILSVFSGITIGAAYLFGALISATDPVAVMALFKEIGAPRRLATLIDGESIFNDATAIVLFSIVLSAVNSHMSSVGGLLLSSLGSFFLVLFGGLFIGAAVGALGGVIVRAQKDNTLIQVTISLIMAYVSFIAADLLHVSGVMSTLAAGIVVSLLSNTVLKHENHYFMEHVWEYLSFVANSFVFLLLGLTEAQNFSDGDKIMKSIVVLLIAIPAITLARAAAVFIFVPIYNRFSKETNISRAFQAILFWGGLRGAVPVALVLAIPQDFPNRDVLVLITFGYILFTLLVQGTTVKGLMNKLHVETEKSYFDYHNGVSYQLAFPAPRLLELVSGQVVSAFKDEGFFVAQGEEGKSGSYLFSRGQKYIALDIVDNDLKITAADQQDLAYGKQTVYETLLELDNSVGSLEDIVKSPELNKIVAEEPTDSKTSFNLGKYLKPSLIEVNLKSTDKDSVITELVDIAADNGAISNRDMVLQAVFEREASMSTGFEHGIAMPHAKIDAAENIVLVVGLQKDGVDFQSLDKKPTKMFFLIISPKSQVGPHIQLLAAIGRKMTSEETRKALVASENPADVISVLKQK